MRDHAVTDRLVRDHLLRLRDDRLRARFVLRTWLEQHDVIGELHGQRVVGAIDSEDAVRQFLRGRARRQPRGRRHGRRRRAAGGGGGVINCAMFAGLASRPESAARRSASRRASARFGRELQAVGVAIVACIRPRRACRRRPGFPATSALSRPASAVDVADDLIRLSPGDFAGALNVTM